MPPRRQANRNSESVDNYLKAILSLGGVEHRRVTSTALAGHLGVAPASVTNMLQKLASAPTPMVEYERHRGVQLSADGKRRALEIVRHHRLIETFLYEVLDYPIEEVHEEAERLEHFISERFEERIAAKLGHPRIDPHGHSIPANIHLSVSQPVVNVPWIEYLVKWNEIHQHFLLHPVKPVNGVITVNDEIGLGMTLDEDKIELEKYLDFSDL